MKARCELGATQNQRGFGIATITSSTFLSIDGNAASKTTGIVWIDLESRVLVQSETTTSIEMIMMVGEPKATSITTSTTKMTLKED